MSACCSLSIWRRSALTAPRTSCASTKLLPGLVAEFGETKPPEVIRKCAEAALASFDDARVRSHVITLAHRKTRECLREETCELVPGLVA